MLPSIRENIQVPSGSQTKKSQIQSGQASIQSQSNVTTERQTIKSIQIKDHSHSPSIVINSDSLQNSNVKDQQSQIKEEQLIKKSLIDKLQFCNLRANQALNYYVKQHLKQDNAHLSELYNNNRKKIISSFTENECVNAAKSPNSKTLDFKQKITEMSAKTALQIATIHNLLSVKQDTLVNRLNEQLHQGEKNKQKTTKNKHSFIQSNRLCYSNALKQEQNSQEKKYTSESKINRRIKLRSETKPNLDANDIPKLKSVVSKPQVYSPSKSKKSASMQVENINLDNEDNSKEDLQKKLNETKCSMNTQFNSNIIIDMNSHHNGNHNKTLQQMHGNELQEVVFYASKKGLQNAQREFEQTMQQALMHQNIQNINFPDQSQSQSQSKMEQSRSEIQEIHHANCNISGISSLNNNFNQNNVKMQSISNFNQNIKYKTPKIHNFQADNRKKQQEINELIRRNNQSTDAKRPSNISEHTLNAQQIERANLRQLQIRMDQQQNAIHKQEFFKKMVGQDSVFSQSAYTMHPMLNKSIERDIIKQGIDYSVSLIQGGGQQGQQQYGDATGKSKLHLTKIYNKQSGNLHNPYTNKFTII